MVTDRKQISKDIDISEGNITLLDKQIMELSAELTDSDKIYSVCEAIINLGPQVARKMNLTTTLNNITTYTNTINTINTNTKKEERILKEIRVIKEEISHAQTRRSTAREILALISAQKKSVYNLTQAIAIQSKATKATENLAPAKARFTELNNHLDIINGLSNEIHRLSNKKQTKVDLIDLMSRKAVLEMYRMNIFKNKETQNGLLTHLEDLKADIDLLAEAKSLFDICPLCGRPFDECKKGDN